MKNPTLIYRDATSDPEAAAQANRSPELRAELLALGFSPVGLAEIRSPELAAGLMSPAPSPDLKKILELTENGEVDEVLSSPDQRTFAAVEMAFERPVVCLRTLFEDGSVVETTMKPERPPQMGSPLAGLPDLSNGLQNNWPMTATMKLMELGMGKMPLWPRVDCPQGGYRVELVETREAGVLWRRHQQRLVDFQRANPTRARLHNFLPLYMAFSCRTTEIIAHQGRLGGRINGFLAVLFILAMPLSILISFQLRPVFKTLGNSPLSAFLALAPILFMLVVAVLAVILMGLAKTYLVPRLPGPKLRPVTELLAEVQTRLTTEAPPRRPAPDQSDAPASEKTNPLSAPVFGKAARHSSLVDRILAGLFAGALLAGAYSWTFASLDWLGIARKLGGGLLLGALTAFWTNSGLNFKDRLLLGAFGGLVTVCLVSFISLEGVPRLVISALVGILVWVIGGRLIQPPAKPAGEA